MAQSQVVEPDQSYYPRCKLRLLIRFEEFADKVFTGKIPKKPAKNLKGTKDDRAPLVLSSDPNAPAGVRRFLLLPRVNQDQSIIGGPQDQSSSSDGLTHVLLVEPPRECRISRNGMRTADTCSFKIRFVDCPIDPRVVRACGVIVFVGTVSAQTHAGQVRGEVALGLPDDWTDDKGQFRSNERFRGFVDKWEIDWADEDEPMISIQCRDNTSLPIEIDAPAGLVIDAKKPLDEAFATYLSHFPALAGISIEFRGAPGETPPVLEASLSKTAFRPNLGPPPSKGGGAAGSDKLSVWDYLTDVAGALGFLVRLEKNTIIVQHPRTLMSSLVQRPDDPFQGRGDWRARRFIYGRNLLSMKMGRQFTKAAPTSIEVRAYLPERKKTIVGRFPSTGDTVADAKPGGVGQDDKWKVYTVSGISDENTLRVIAQNIYEQLGRNELEVNMKTHNLASFGGGNLDPDLLDMQTADSVEVLVNRDSGEERSTITRIEESLKVIDKSVAFMKSLGFSETFSVAYARAYTNAGFQTIFRCKTVEIAWNMDEPSLELNIVAINYLEVKSDKLLNGI